MLGGSAERSSVEDGVRPRHARDGWVTVGGPSRVPERVGGCRTRTFHHRSIYMFPWAWRVGE
jgi:hypothetical protein